MIFTSVTKTAGVPADYPPLNVPNQRVEWNMHGSGGGYDTTLAGPSPSYYKGDKYIFAYQSAISGSQVLEIRVSSGGGYGSTLPTPNPPAFVSITPIDRVIYPNGRQGETLHSGFRHGASHAFAAEREDAYRSALDWFKANLSNVDWTRCISGGTIGGHINNSMGAGAMCRWAMRQKQDFAFVGGSSPRFKGLSVKDWETSTDIATPAGQTMDDGSDYAAAFDFPAYVADIGNLLPFFMWTSSTGDVSWAGSWSYTLEVIAALRARIRNPALGNDKRSGFACGWVPGAHGAAGIGSAVLTAMNASYPRDGWKLGQGYPVFDRSSLDDPVSAASGYINRGFAWRNLVETASGWSCEVSNTLGACTVEVWPHSEVFTGAVTAPQVATIPAGQWVAVSFSGGGQLPADPTITGFAATPGTITAGQQSVLNATVANGVSLTVDGVTATLPLTVTPSVTHTYTLVATGAAGTTPATATATVTVSATVDPCQSIMNERDAALAKIAAAVAILTAP